MATVAIDGYSFITVSDSCISDTALPPIENTYGDNIYIPKIVETIGPVYRQKDLDHRYILYAVAVSLVLTLSVVVWSIGGRFMVYIPLYVALAPIVYWLLKISYAYCLVKCAGSSLLDDFDSHHIENNRFVKRINSISFRVVAITKKLFWR
ncbi:TPA: hypothetical protein ACXF60_003045 [Escherichia coli]|uniref:hypothetical protein n=1 Tax=Escherichia TaxID=561 RepID=UPI0010CBB6AE|nr:MULTISPECIES: hypothetical protein [Escherichia]MCY5019151.1 hypothetical protein [Salmonella enterica subsp. enterica serovar 1,4,[5],12:i:-]EEU9535960.1 hypothetical protein [Escherichia coli]EEV7775240.1 hypothetical protein [Escherichia coli]EFA5132422.1 hypothetical protein [Escherichia coli]EFB6194345.1 hypothetical protein [Escherichia coli]